MRVQFLVAGKALQFRTERFDRLVQCLSRFGGGGDSSIQTLESFDAVGWKAGNFGNRLQLAANRPGLVPMRPDSRQESMTRKLLSCVRLLALQIFDAVLDSGPLAAAFGVFLAQGMAADDFVPQRLVTFQQVCQAARAGRR